MELDTVRSSDFQPHIGSRFEIRLGNDALVLTLVEVTELAGSPYPTSNRNPFSLIFRGDPARVLPQRIYPLTHAVLGEISIFLVPITPDGNGARYEAIFN